LAVEAPPTLDFGVSNPDGNRRVCCVSAGHEAHECRSRVPSGGTWLQRLAALRYPAVGGRLPNAQSRRCLNHCRIATGYQLDQLAPLLTRVSSAHTRRLPIPARRRHVGFVQRLRILRAITSAKPFLPLAVILRVAHLEPGRYHRWNRASTAVCGLDDRSSCPRTSPSQLTPIEVADIKEMVLAPEHRHMPLGTLARYAQRIGKVFAAASTWANLVRQHGWRRPRQRLHPPKPTVGVRASQPNEIWHIDTTLI